MRVTLTAPISGLRDGRPWPATGESIDLPADEAEQLVRLGVATEGKPAKSSETTDAPPAGETTDAPPPKPKRARK
jgi:hypothetical protein